jgi:DNA-binding MarR family transcriptional regulator
MSMASSGSAGQSTLLHAVKVVELAIRSHLDALLRPSGLTAAQYTALTVLADEADLTSAQLARECFVTAQSMADMVGGLEARKLVTRRRDPADRRRLVLSVTANGRRLLARLRPKVAAVEAQMLSGLSARQSSELRRHLGACRAALRA